MHGAVRFTTRGATYNILPAITPRISGKHKIKDSRYCPTISGDGMDKDKFTIMLDTQDHFSDGSTCVRCGEVIEDSPNKFFVLLYF